MSSSPVPRQIQRLCLTSWTGPVPLAWMRSGWTSSRVGCFSPDGVWLVFWLGLAGLLGWPGGGGSGAAGEVLVGVLRHHEPGGGEDGHRVFARRGEDVDGVVAHAVGDDEPFVVGQDDLGLLGGLPRQGACSGGGAVPGAFGGFGGPAEYGGSAGSGAL